MGLDSLFSDPEGVTTTEDYIKHFQKMNPEGSEDAFNAAKQARIESDKGKIGNARDLNMRDAEHALFSQTAIDQYGPVLGRLMVGTTVPGYTAAKVLAKSYPVTEPAVRALTGMDFRNSTSPDLRELYWGLRPVFKSIK